MQATYAWCGHLAPSAMHSLVQLWAAASPSAGAAWVPSAASAPSAGASWCIGQVPLDMHSGVHTWSACSVAGALWPPSPVWSAPPIAINGAITRATIEVNLMRMFIDGPEVSLKGSPTVSPVTAALWGSLPFLKVWPSMTTPFSKLFLALSQAPPPVHRRCSGTSP